MEENTYEMENASTRRPRSVEDEEDISKQYVHKVGMELHRDDYEEDYRGSYGGDDQEMKPTKIEVFGWHLYGMCSYFIHTVLIPIVFPLIISQTLYWPQKPQLGLVKNAKGLECRQRELELYEMLTKHRMNLAGTEYSALEWTSISWIIGLILEAPVLGFLSIHLDYGRNQQLIAAASTAIGGLFCLPAGFFKTRWIFPPYIAAIVAANTIVSSCHARHLGLMVRGLVGSPIRKSQFPDRKAVASWLSLHSTAAGCLGAALMSAFTYHMLRKSDSFTSLWVVSIFSGLIWFIGMVHIATSNRPGQNADLHTNSAPKTHVVSIFKYPHAAGSLAGVFLSSFTTMCIFTAGVLYSIGVLCIPPGNILKLWLTYFIFPLVSLPLTHPFQHLIRADAVKMQLLGFILSAIVSGFGFYYRHDHWNRTYIFIFTAIQTTATGILHAFGRVLWLDCSPSGKEGAFSVWFSWIRALGACAGFALASTSPQNIEMSFGVAFCAAILGKIILIFGNISNFGGAKAAGHVKDSERGSPVPTALDIGVEIKEPVSTEVQEEEKVQI
uniref:Major facilitator superfamily (MFS) profile domain-containing protein n=1 Tax=Solanum lycopersicum TaxID=4081 RepID=A0A3Q7IMG8_SOLLC